jgi:hypothetical protein
MRLCTCIVLSGGWISKLFELYLFYSSCLLPLTLIFFELSLIYCHCIDCHILYFVSIILSVSLYTRANFVIGHCTVKLLHVNKHELNWTELNWIIIVFVIIIISSSSIK